MFKNRYEAGEILAEILHKRNLKQPCLLAVPRGGIVVAAPIMRKLGVKAQVLVTRKIGHPADPEVAIGAVMPDGTAVWEQQALTCSGITLTQAKQLVEQEYNEIQRRLLTYSGSTEAPNVQHKTAIIIDDGIATGYTIRAAVKWLKTLNPATIMIAVPVGPPEVVNSLAAEVNEVLCPLQPKFFGAVGMFYADFPQVTDEEVLHILKSLFVE
jgi:predicted phosphoribosyltransferase